MYFSSQWGGVANDGGTTHPSSMHAGAGRAYLPDADITDESMRRERRKARELRSSPWWKRRRAGGVCHYCGANVGPGALTMDHLVPLARGGRSTKGNIVPACKDCNNKKKHALPFEWAPPQPAE